MVNIFFLLHLLPLKHRRLAAVILEAFQGEADVVAFRAACKVPVFIIIMYIFILCPCKLPFQRVCPQRAAIYVPYSPKKLSLNP